MTVVEIVEELEALVKKPSGENKDFGKQLLQSKDSDSADLEMYKCMKMCLVEFPPLLTKHGELANKRRDNKPEFVYSNLDDVVGKRFKNQVYRYLAKGLVTPNFLESLANQELITEPLVAPSNLNKAVWDQADFRELFGLSVRNFLKERDQEVPQETLGATHQMLANKEMKTDNAKPMDLHVEETAIQTEVARQGV